MKGDVWTGSKSQRAALMGKYGGRCGYCGEVLTKMQADHIKPVTRIVNDAWGKPLPKEERRMVCPELNVVSNMMPACPPCNNHKGGYDLDGWREILSRAGEIVAREKSIFRAAVRMGLIEVRDIPVTFYFERVDNMRAKP